MHAAHGRSYNVGAEVDAQGTVQYFDGSPMAAANGGAPLPGHQKSVTGSISTQTNTIEIDFPPADVGSPPLGSTFKKPVGNTWLYDDGGNTAPRVFGGVVTGMDDSSQGNNPIRNYTVGEVCPPPGWSPAVTPTSFGGGAYGPMPPAYQPATVGASAPQTQDNSASQATSDTATPTPAPRKPTGSVNIHNVADTVPTGPVGSLPLTPVPWAVLIILGVIGVGLRLLRRRMA